MATYYWVGGNGTWDDSTTTNWALVSGGVGGFGPPSNADDIIFDQAATYTVAIIFNSISSTCRNITVSAGTVAFNANAGAVDIYGSMSLTSSTTWTTGLPSTFPITFRGIGSNTLSAPSVSIQPNLIFTTGTVTLQSNITNASQTQINGGTLNLNGFVFTALSVNHTAGTLNFDSSSVTLTGGGAYTFNNAGTLNLNGNSLTCYAFNSSGAGARTIAFGSTGSITVNGIGTIWDTTTSTGLVTTGSKTVNVSNTTGSGATISGGVTGATINTVCNFKVNSGSYALTATGAFGDLDLTGFSGNLASSIRTIYGNLTLSAVGGFAVTSGVNAMTFAATSSKTITTNGKTIDVPLVFNGSGGTWVLQDNLTMGSTRQLSHTNGTINLNGQTLTVGTTYATLTGTKNLTFNGGVLVCPNSGTTAFNNAVAGLTTTAGTSPGQIRMTSATAKTFAGFGVTYNCTLVQAGSGNLTITGANTFYDITNTVTPCTVIFAAGVNQTFNNFNLNGTAGNLVTITSSSVPTTYNLTKSSGIVSVNYLNVNYSIGIPTSTTWYAGTTSTNGTPASNAGWIFTAPPTVANTGSFFLMF